MKVIQITGDTARQAAISHILSAPEGYFVKISEATRTLEQNALLWPLLEKVSEGVNWYGQKLTSEEWKDVLSASLKRTKVVPGLDGGFVVCGQSTSRMTRAEMCELHELMEAFGAQQGVKFRAPEGWE